MLPMPPFVSPDPASTVAFVGIVAGVVVAAIAAIYTTSRSDGEATARGRAGSAAAVAAAWLALTAIAPAAGWVEAAPVAMFAFFFGSNAFAVGVALSPVGRWLARAPLAALVGFHAFRLPLEIVLHHWATLGTIPVDMSWSGRNFDVITGLVAPLVALAARHRPDDRKAPALFTALGLALLLNVARVALSCAPLPLPLHVDCAPPLALAVHAPYAWIVSVCVAGALGAHVVAIRALVQAR